MKVEKITAYERTNFGKRFAKRLRKEAQLPCVLYGGKKNLHLYIPMSELENLIYTPEVFFITLHVKGHSYTCIFKELQFHPVSEMLLHVDFLQIFEDKKIQMQIPIRTVGSSLGVAKGGALLEKLRRISVVALPKDMPAYIDVDISGLDLGQTAKIKDIVTQNYTLQEHPSIPVVSIGIPRALRSKESEKEKAKDAK